MTLNEWGEIRLMSDEEPEPGEVGFLSVVSMSVQPSPLKPQLPVGRGCWGRCRERGASREEFSLISAGRDACFIPPSVGTHLSVNNCSGRSVTDGRPGAVRDGEESGTYAMAEMRAPFEV